MRCGWGATIDLGPASNSQVLFHLVAVDGVCDLSAHRQVRVLVLGVPDEALDPGLAWPVGVPGRPKCWAITHGAMNSRVGPAVICGPLSEIASRIGRCSSSTPRSTSPSPWRPSTAASGSRPVQRINCRWRLRLLPGPRGVAPLWCAVRGLSICYGLAGGVIGALTLTSDRSRVRAETAARPAHRAAVPTGLTSMQEAAIWPVNSVRHPQSHRF